MSAEKQFRLKRATLALDTADGKQTIPAGAVVKVISGQCGVDRMVKVFWAGRTFMMLAMDVHGTEIGDRNARA